MTSKDEIELKQMHLNNEETPAAISEHGQS